jgi:hypothetical protein
VGVAVVVDTGALNRFATLLTPDDEGAVNFFAAGFDRDSLILPTSVSAVLIFGSSSPELQPSSSSLSFAGARNLPKAG